MTSINQSAGILIYRAVNANLEFLLVHPGGPFYFKKDLGVWTIPKGVIEPREDVETAARREFFEETSLLITNSLIKLLPITMKSGKVVHAFAVHQDLDIKDYKSNDFTFHGKNYPEVDQAEWFDRPTALQKIHPSQLSFLNQVVENLI